MNDAQERALSPDDLYLFNEGTHCRLYEKLGAHLIDGGARFAVWAPSAERVTVMGDFNGWNRDAHPLEPTGSSGIWAGEIQGAMAGQCYKYHVLAGDGHTATEKADPFGFAHEVPPRTASVLTSLDYTWGDDAWMHSRGPKQTLAAPISIYEVHLGSWIRDPADPGRLLSYREIAPRLAKHARELGFTHVELLPVAEHPFYGSWGYQVTGYFAPTSRYGGPLDFMHLVDTLHQAGLGVILDWVPAHFPADPHGLGMFDGTHLYEHADPRKGWHPDWSTYIFNYDRHEVRSFLLSSALFWLDRYHIDGLRVDGVASMLYLDYSRNHGEWIPNEYGGRENIGAISLLRQLNETVYREYPDAQTFAEESTAWPMVSRPTYVGGLGFGLKWDMGWMHDTLKYMEREPIHRKYHHNELTFRAIYQFNENFVMPLSHDEVVHGKGSLLSKMPGDTWQKLANLRLLLTLMTAQPGKKLLFMGTEIAPWNEWHHDQSLDWHLLEDPSHRGVRDLIAALNRVYREHGALHERDCDATGFEWVEGGDADSSVLAFNRVAHDGSKITFVGNFTPIPRHNYRVGVDTPGTWQELMSSDRHEFGGSGHVNVGSLEASPVPWHGRHYSLNLTLPPLGGLYVVRSR